MKKPLFSYWAPGAFAAVFLFGTESGQHLIGRALVLAWEMYLRWQPVGAWGWLWPAYVVFSARVAAAGKTEWPVRVSLFLFWPLIIAAGWALEKYEMWRLGRKVRAEVRKIWPDATVTVKATRPDEN